MQTHIEYNSVRIVDVLTDGISVSSEKDRTGVDQVGSRVRASYTGVVHTSAQDLLGKKSPNLQLGDGINTLLALLSKDRRPFKMTIGQAIVFDVRPGASEPNAPGAITVNLDAMDIDNGPKPSVEVLKITSGSSATIRFTIEFVTPNCGGGTAVNNSGLVNFWFKTAEDIDCGRTWLTSRTYVGGIRVAHKNIDVHKIVRQIAFPPQQRGFKRFAITLDESEDGLHLDFVIRDQEIIAAAPWVPGGKYGAIDWQGTHMISTQGNGAISISDITIALTGPKTTSKEDLFELALRVVEAKVHLFAMLADNSVFLEHFGMKDVLQDNAIEVSARLKHTGEKSYALGVWGLGAGFDIGKPLGDLGIGFDDQVAYQPGQTAGLAGLFLRVLQTPCAPAKMPHVIDNPPTNAEPVYKAGAKDFSPLKYIQNYDAAALSPGHKKDIYLDYEINSDLIANSGKIALPTGAASDSNASSIALVQLYRPTAHREIRIEATRVGKPPELPTPNVKFNDSNGIEHVQIGDAFVTPSVPQLSADARRLLYGATMQIKYALSRPPKIGESVAVGCLPYRTSSPGDSTRQIPKDMFVKPETLLT